MPQPCRRSSYRHQAAPLRPAPSPAIPKARPARARGARYWPCWGTMSLGWRLPLRTVHGCRFSTRRPHRRRPRMLLRPRHQRGHLICPRQRRQRHPRLHLRAWAAPPRACQYSPGASLPSRAQAASSALLAGTNTRCRLTSRPSSGTPTNRSTSQPRTSTSR